MESVNRRPAIFAHVVYLDLVRSSSWPIEVFTERASALRKLVTETPEVQQSARFGRVQIEDTGDGLSLAFQNDPTASAKCVSDVCKRLLLSPGLRVRIGVHSGPLLETEGIDGPKLTGAAFAEAKRVMEAARPGQALLSSATAGILSHFKEWSDRIGPARQLRTKGRRIIHVFEFLPLPKSRTGFRIGATEGGAKTRVRYVRVGALVGLPFFALALLEGGRMTGATKTVAHYAIPRHTGHSWDLARQFGTKNPNGPWSYGQRVNGVFTVLSHFYVQQGSVGEWNAMNTSGPYGVISVNGREQRYGVSPGHASLQADGGSPDARWTSPVRGTYNVFAAVGGPATGDRYGRGNYDAQRASVFVDGNRVPYTVFSHNRMFFDLRDLRLEKGHTIDLVVGRMKYGGNTDTVFKVTAVSPQKE